MITNGIFEGWNNEIMTTRVIRKTIKIVPKTMEKSKQFLEMQLNKFVQSTKVKGNKVGSEW